MTIESLILKFQSYFQIFYNNSLDVIFSLQHLTEWEQSGEFWTKKLLNCLKRDLYHAELSNLDSEVKKGNEKKHILSSFQHDR